METLKGKVAIVTGGAQGLGEAVCQTLADEGVIVIITDINKNKAENVMTTITSNGGQAVFKTLDVGNEILVKNVVNDVKREFGHIDILINNAGIDLTAPFDELSIGDWDKIVNVNLRGPFLLTKFVLPIMYSQKSGHIINICSTASKRAWSNASGYHATKWGLLGLSHALYTEARLHNVKVSAVIAGGMKTPFILERFPETDQTKLQDPQNVADTIVFILHQPDETIIPEVLVLPLQETSWP